MRRLPDSEQFSMDAQEYRLGAFATIPVGPVGATKNQRLLVPQQTAPSGDAGSLVTVALERPLGIVFEEGEGGRIVVTEVMAGSNAGRQARLAQLTQQGSYVRAGDVLAAATTVEVLYGPQALAGASAPVRTWVSFIAAGLMFGDVMERLQRGREGDGPVHLVLWREHQ